MARKKKSSIWTIFNDRAKLYDLQERISEFQSLTEKCIQFCLTNDWLAIDDKNLSLEYITTSDQKLTLQKNAANFGKLVSGHSVIELYAFLGVKPR
ncbi:three component ABC system middle component [Pseudomonas aeruginosa]